MAPGTRSSKRWKDDIIETPDTVDTGGASEVPSKVRKKRRDSKPSGYPFTDLEVEWKYERHNLLRLTPKAVPGGYENIAGVVNKVLKGLHNRYANKVRDSALGQYTRLDDLTTRSGNMLHYVICHQVTPTPDFDPTSLFFKFGRKVLRFSRVEYALVSGLKFGPANFNPYGKHEMPPESLFNRLFGGDLNTTLYDVRKGYMEKKFPVKGVEVRPAPEDNVKLSKMILCLGYVLGFEPTKKKIPLWLWVLLEDEEGWEAFPWGSMSYQILLDTIKGLPKTSKGEKKVNYNVKGNTVAFSAWIFEAIPAFGEEVGLAKEEFQIPRFMRYSYVKERGYPDEDKIAEKLVRKLNPTDEEMEELYMKSLEEDPEGNPFAFTYDPTESMKKKNRDEEGVEGEFQGEGTAGSMGTLTAVNVAEVAKATVQVGLEQLKEFLREYHDTLINDVANKVTSILLARDPNDNDDYYKGGCYEECQGIADECGGSQSVVVAKTTNTALPAEVAKTGELAHEEHSLFSLGIDNANLQARDGEATKLMPPPPPKTPQIQVDATKYVQVAVMEHRVGVSPLKSASTSGTEPETCPSDKLQESETISDSQIDAEFDKLASIVVTPLPLKAKDVTTTNVRPARIKYPSRACRSPFLRNDKRPRPDRFQIFMETPNEIRNIGLPYDVDREFFEDIMEGKKFLTEDHVNSYLAVICSNPTLAGLKAVKPNVGVTCCYFMSRIMKVFDKIHKDKKPKSGVYEYNTFKDNIEEEVPTKKLEKLLVFADGSYPPWGEDRKEWTSYEKIVGICKFKNDWVTVVIDMVEQELVIHDPKAWDMQQNRRQQNLNIFVPMARLVPQMMKAISYDTLNNIENPRHAQWPISFGPHTGRNAFREKELIDSPLYCMRYVEKLIATDTSSSNGLRTKAELKEYRKHVAKTIYSNSTDSEVTPMLVGEVD